MSTHPTPRVRPVAPALERWLTVAQVAETLGLSLATVRCGWKSYPGLARAARKLGRTLRFDADAIARMQREARVVGGRVGGRRSSPSARGWSA